MTMAPTMKMRTLICKAHLRPIFSVRGRQKSAPKNAPAWKADVMLLEMLLAWAAVTLKSVLKLWRAMVVPMKAES